MANSLRNKIKHLCYKGELSERERDRLLNALDNADRINSASGCENCLHFILRDSAGIVLCGSDAWECDFTPKEG